MNKLVIIGNGFDLAHGLPTSYSDFINWYWRDILNNIPSIFHSHFKNDLIEIQLLFKETSLEDASSEFIDVNCYTELKEFTTKYSEAYQLEYAKNHDCCYIRFFNSFFETICNKHSIQNWVDIENEYYKLLKDCLKEEDNSKVIKLNEEFDQVKNLLEKYLKKEVVAKYKFDKPNNHLSELLKYFEVRPYSLDSTYWEEIPKYYHEKLKKYNDEIIKYSDDRTLKQKIWNGTVQENNLLLNFNYTFTVDKLKRTMDSDSNWDIYGKSDIIQIHGRLNNPDNKINFGFGDEMDDHYKQIEEKDDNEYLRYIKSFQYLQNSNYKKVLDYIESDIFQVYIMGHSCGLSDRILLNTIFEHTNCVSIKVFYHQKPDGSDNYTEIVQNISRHFNKKKMMRDKIVNKSLCVPLPQNIRFEKISD